MAGLPSLTPLGRRLLERYRGAGPAARLFLGARWRWTPYEQIASHMPSAGLVLDLGSGHGLLSLALSLSAPARNIIGIDHEPRRLAIAQTAARGLTNVTFESGSLTDVMIGESRVGMLAGIAIVDAIHYLSFAEQEKLVRRAMRALQPGGVLLIRDVDAGAGQSFFVNRLYEKLMTGIGLTRADRLNFRSRRDWHQLLDGVGYECASEPCSRFPFADHLFICRRPAAEVARAA